MRLLIMGPPGAGKGTQAAIIGEHYGIPAISTGNIFRLAITNRTKLGERIKRIIADGGYVPDSLSVQVVVDRLKKKMPRAAGCWTDFRAPSVRSRRWTRNWTRTASRSRRSSH